MESCTITLYKKTANWKLLPQNLFMLDDISAYLSAVSSSDKITLSNMMKVKNKLEIEIKIDMSQTNANPITNFAYVEIKNSDEGRSYYYYIKEIEWRSTMTCRFILVMDVLNSIKYGTDYTLSPKTKINRQHKNRLVKRTKTEIILVLQFNVGYPVDLQDYIDENIRINALGLGVFRTGKLLHVAYTGSNNVYYTKMEYTEDLYNFLIAEWEAEGLVELKSANNTFLIGGATMTAKPSIDVDTYYYRKIDYLSENISAVTYHDMSIDELINNDDNDSDWYLIYATDNVPTTTELNNPLRCYLCTDKNLVVQPNQPIVQGRIYPEMLEEGKYYYFLGPNVYGGTVVTLSNLTTIAVEFGDILTIYKCGNKIIVNFKDHNFTGVFGYDPTDYVSITNDLTFAYSITIDYDTYPSGSPTKTFYATAYPQVTLDTIEDLDRTNSKIVKVIKLPYAPYNFTYSGTTLIIPDEWEFGVFEGKNFLKLKDLNTKFTYDFDSSVNNINSLLQLTSAPDYTQVRNDTFESKIYHSDYYVPKVVYDSFSFAFNMEKVDLPYVHSARAESQLKLTFTCTTTVNSRFMLSFPQYQCAKLGTQDYNNVMPIVRNNEIALYNVPYINYIRNGYNYDVKTKNRQTAMNMFSLGLGLAGTVASLLLPTSPITTPLVIGLGASTIKSLVSTISSQAQSEQNIQQKIQEAQSQGASVSGSDDVDLMSEYTSNRASLMTYNMSDVMKDLLLDLFYYTGYTDNTMGTPNLTTRKWFNFVSCDAIITTVNGQLVNISDEIQNELINLWKTGVTVLHKVNNAYDMEQVKENAEVTIAEL